MSQRLREVAARDRQPFVEAIDWRKRAPLEMPLMTTPSATVAMRRFSIMQSLVHSRSRTEYPMGRTFAGGGPGIIDLSLGTIDRSHMTERLPSSCGRSPDEVRVSTAGREVPEKHTPDDFSLLALLMMVGWSRAVNDLPSDANRAIDLAKNGPAMVLAIPSESSTSTAKFKLEKLPLQQSLVESLSHGRDQNRPRRRLQKLHCLPE